MRMMGTVLEKKSLVNDLIPSTSYIVITVRKQTPSSGKNNLLHRIGPRKARNRHRNLVLKSKKRQYQNLTMNRSRLLLQITPSRTNMTLMSKAKQKPVTASSVVLLAKLANNPRERTTMPAILKAKGLMTMPVNASPSPPTSTTTTSNHPTPPFAKKSDA